MNMRPSRVLRKLRNGEAVSCLKLNLSDGRSAEIAAMQGFDCLWADLEHIPTDFSAIEHQIWIAKAYDTDVLVRVARGSYSDLIRPLEMDAAGIMVPHIMSLEDARNVVRMTRFHPTGRRAVDGGNSDGAYCGIPVVDYMKQANTERFVSVQIEDPEPLPDLDAIAALPGIDMIFFGPGDFSHGIGVPGEYSHPRVTSARDRVAEAAAKHGKFAGTTAAWPVEELMALGYRFIPNAADVVGLMQYCKKALQDFRSATDGSRIKDR